MSQDNFTITGQVIDNQTNQGIPGLRVEAWDKDLIFHDLVGSADTDRQGRFSMTFDSGYFSEIFFDRRPDLFFKIFREDRQIQPVETPFIPNMQPGERKITIKVDLSAAEVPKEFVVKGTILHDDSTPAAWVLVRAFDRDLRSEEFLGEAVTGQSGQYEITYTAEQFARLEKDSADLVIRVFDDHEELLLQSDTFFNTGQVEKINLVLGSGIIQIPSEYDQLVSELTPLLGDLSFADLEENDEHQDIFFLSNETGKPRQHISALITAHRFENYVRDLIGVEAGDSFSLIAPVFYGLFREGMPLDLHGLLSQSQELIRRALLKALADNIIPAEIEEDLERILEQLHSLIPLVAIHLPVHIGSSTFNALLNTVITDSALQESFVARYISNQGTIEEFWEGLRGDPAFAGEVENIQFALQLDAVTGSHLPLVKKLQDRKDSGEINAVSDVAQYTEDDWIEMMNLEVDGQVIGVPPEIPGLDDEEKTRNYARAMTRLTEDAFPSAFVKYRLANDNLEGKEDLIRFLDNSPSFNIKRDSIESYLEQNPGATAGISDVAAFLKRIKAMQRVYRVAPRYEMSAALLKDGIDSAWSISRMGKNVFLKKYGEPVGMVKEAVHAYECARQAHAMSLHLATEYGLQNSIDMHTVPDASVMHAISKTDLQGIPDWSTLFGSLELCGCEHCRSVRSPAAYFVDILEFLGSRHGKGNQSARDILFKRRPDLGDINLSCENTKTPLPYVDLVNEILEEAVAPPGKFQPFELDSSLEADLNARDFSQELHDAFRDNDCPLFLEYPEITVGGEAEGRDPIRAWWNVNDIDFTYHIFKQEGHLQVVSRSRQTRGNAVERRAIPQYMNPGAYETMGQEVYPWTLPFDLDRETIKIYLSHLGTSRAEILETFLPGKRAEILESRDLAREILDLCGGETTIIAGETATEEPWTLWGFTGEESGSIPDPADSTGWIVVSPAQNWLDILTSRMDVFLQQSGLKYRQVLDLFSVNAINPINQDSGKRQICIQSRDPEIQDTCDLQQLKIEGMDLSTAVLVVRFVRLWRKLGWSIQDLGRAFSVLGPVYMNVVGPDEEQREANQDFLVRLSNVRRLQLRLNLPTETVLVFWADIDTNTCIDHQAEEQPVLPSLYTRLFRNKNVINPPDPSFTADPADLSGTLSEHIGTITAALGISTDDFMFLVRETRVVPHDNLNLDNLSSLYRHVMLADALKLRIRDYLRLLRLSGRDPFGLNGPDVHCRPVETLLFVEEVVDTVRNSGLSITELDYLLRHSPSSVQALAPGSEETAQVLAEIRSGLQAISAENTYTVDMVDPNGGITCQKLALLEWDQERIDRVRAILNDEVDFEATLSALPDNIEFPPEELNNRVQFDEERQRLIFKGVMSAPERDLLEQLASNDSNYTAAIDDLYNTPRAFFLRNLRTFSVPDCSKELSESLATFVAGLEFPVELKDRIYFDTTTRTLHFRGVMTEQEKEGLFSLGSQQEYLDAIAFLFDFPVTRKAEKSDRFFYYEDDNINDIYKKIDEDLLFINDISTIPADRFSALLERLLPCLKERLSRSHVIQIVSTNFSLEMQTCTRLLDQWLELKASGQHDKPLWDVFLDSAFAESSTQNPITRENFPEQFRAYLLLHKVALIISRLELTFIQLGWLFDFPTDSWPNLNDLPLEEADCIHCSLDKWLHLFRLCTLRETLPNGESVLDRFFNLTKEEDSQEQDSKTALIELLDTALAWSAEDVGTLIGAESGEKGLLAFKFPQDYHDETAFRRLQACFSLLKRLGISASLCGELGEGSLQDNISNRVIQAVRAKYDEKRWLEVARPLQDQLRNMQRAALVDYLVTHPREDNPWKNANDLYAYFLIDPEMDACMMTSRIKQAISSVQLFVQRCLMNLEKDVAAGSDVDVNWRQWKWMKNYRVWEANRRIFLYPENWIEPELRDDKSPFFRELESELMQSDLTLETAAEAFLHYLEKLDQVARLEIVGEYHQVERDRSGHIAVDILHVFGRTKATPHVYFYRQRVNSATWTAWERIDLDIEGDHLIPVVWNRRLYLFWPIFTEKTHPVETGNKKITDLNTSEINPAKYWEIKLAWSERKQGKWLNKKISDQFIKFDFFNFYMPRADNPATFFFRTIVDDQGRLHLLILPKRLLMDFVWCQMPAPAFRFHGCGSEPIVTEMWSDNVRRSRKKSKFQNLTTITQRLTRQKSQILDFLRSHHVINHPRITDYYYMFFKESEEVVASVENKLFLPVPTDSPALNKTPGIFLLLPHPDGAALYRQPFFYLDDERDFFVEPSSKIVSPDISIGSDNKIDPGNMQVWLDGYQSRQKFAIDTGGPVENPEDPVVSEPTYPDYGDMPVGHGQALRSLSTKTFMAAETSASISGASANIEVGGWEVVHEYNWGGANNYVPRASLEYHYKFSNFYHPYVCSFISYLNRDGIDGLLQRPMQLQSALLFSFILDGDLDENNLKRQFREHHHTLTDNAVFASVDITTATKIVIRDRGIVYTVKKASEKVEVYKNLFEDIYQPNKKIIEQPFPYDEVDFENDGSYSLYNWEIFFHAPLMIADRLSKNQRFEEAQKWFHYIFDPTDLSGEQVPQKYWRTKRFFETTRDGYRKARIEYILRLLARGANPEDLSPDERADLERLSKSVSQWRNDPFKPHLIARLRTTSYQKSVVMKYIDNLIAWGDRLFRRDTIESINEATQIYILAADILGRRPEDIPPRTRPSVHTYNELQQEGTGSFSNAMVEIENFIPPSAACEIIYPGEAQPLPDMLYFCVPKNSKLLRYWDTVADRLFKIRHCMNIEGMVRKLPLFEPPIEPGLLVRAAAAGVDISSALNDLNAALPYYRFQVMAQKATELCGELKSLSTALLSALEKRDAEKLAMLRAEHESSLLKRVEQIKKLQIDEANENMASLRKSRETVLTRYLHYQKLLGVKSPKIPSEGETISLAEPSSHVQIKEKGGVKMIPYEQEDINKQKESQDKQEIAAWSEFAASIAYIIPNWSAAFMGTGPTLGGANLGAAASATARFYQRQSTDASYQANLSAKFGQYVFRSHDWTLQNNLAAREIMQIDKQILAAEIRREMAEKELDNHRKQIEEAEGIEEFLKDKYTNLELYNWMSGQISGIYFQAYQLAYDVAKRAERAWRHELGLSDSGFINFGYWDSLKKGLLAGEKLYQDIKRMEVAYLEKNRREYELTKHVSLLQLNPLALIQLRMTGSCTVSIPEELFDMDGPGHYFRRIKNVAITIPCVTGPYTGVDCKLTLLKSSIRRVPTASGGEDYSRRDEDDRFVDYFGSMESIVASSGQGDSGLFETNLRDERYLPFENSGVISEWRLELPADPSADEPQLFDYDTISDVILHIRYTAREGGTCLRNAAKDHLKSAFSEGGAAGMLRLFSIRHEFPSEWQDFKSQSEVFNLNVHLRPEHYPFWLQQYLQNEGDSQKLYFLARPENGQVDLVEIYEQPDNDNVATLEPDMRFGDLLFGQMDSSLWPDHGCQFHLSTNELSELWMITSLY